MGMQPCCISSYCLLCGSESWAHWDGTGSRRDLRKLISFSLKLDIEQPSITLYPCFLVFISAYKLTSVTAYKFSPITSWFVRSICFAIRKTHHHLGILWQITPSLSQTLPARWHALPCACHQFRRFLPPWPQPTCLPSSAHWKLWTVHASLLWLRPPVYATARLEISAYGSWRDHRQHHHLAQGFQPDSADSTRFAVSASAPAVMTTAAAAVVIWNCYNRVCSLSRLRLARSCQ